MATVTKVVDPTKLTGAAERAYRAQNPNSDYTKSVQTRFVRQVDDMMKNNKGVSSDQLNHANELRQKWNLADPNAFNQENFLKGMQDNLNNIYNQQKQAQLAQLQASRNKAISGIQGQMSQVAPEYQQKRNQADVVNNQNVKRLREVMAANGLQSSGENLTATVGLNNERQNSLNSLNLQEQQTMDDFQRRITDINDPSEENAIIAALEAERSKSLYDAYNRANDVGYQRTTDERNFNYQKSRDARADAEWESIQKYNRLRDKRRDAEWESQTKYDRSRDKKQDAQWESSQKADRAWREYTFKNMSASEKAQLEWAKTQYGEDAAWRLYEMKYNGELAKGQYQAELEAYKSGFNGGSGGGGYSNNYKTQQQASKSGSYKTYQTHLQQAISKGGVPASWASALTELVGRESSWNPSAKNPNSTAHGYGQFLNSTRSAYEKKTGLSYSNPVNQLIMMAQYVKDRYGTPEKALAFWDKNKWY